MYNSTDKVVYGSSGICTVEGTTIRDFGNSKCEYYVLKPILNEKTTIYAPKSSPGSTSNIRDIITNEKANQIISEFSSYDAEWNANDIERKAQFRTALRNQDSKALAIVLKTIYKHKSELSKTGKKLHSYDEDFMRNAEKLLFSELSFALKCDIEKIYELLKF